MPRLWQLEQLSTMQSDKVSGFLWWICQLLLCGSGLRAQAFKANPYLDCFRYVQLQDTVREACFQHVLWMLWRAAETRRCVWMCNATSTGQRLLAVERLLAVASCLSRLHALSVGLCCLLLYPACAAASCKHPCSPKHMTTLKRSLVPRWSQGS